MSPVSSQSPLYLPSSSSTTATSTASVLHGPKDLRLETRPVRPPPPGCAQVQIISTGLCGSDLHYYTHGRNGDFVLRSPLVLGHEASGIITALGPPLTSSAPSTLRVGQRVALEVGISCKQCRYCLDPALNGSEETHGPRYNLCENMRFCSSAKTFPHLDGTLQGRMNHPVELLHPIPDSCSYEIAALAEPLAVVVHASRRANFHASSVSPPRVCVIGSGAVGLLACSLSIALGASNVTAIDIDETKLEFARNVVGVTDTWKVPMSKRPIDRDEGVQKSREMAENALSDLGIRRGDGFDIVFECTGVESCIQMAIFLARPGSRVALVGMGTPIGYIPLSSSALREVDLIGVFRYANCYPEALSLLGSGRLRGVERMVTQRFPIEKTDKAFETLRQGRGDDGELVVKVMIDVTSPPVTAQSNPIGRATLGLAPVNEGSMLVPPELA